MPRTAPITANDIRQIIKEEIKPFLDRQELDHEQIRTITQIISGATGANGLVGDNKAQKKFNKTILYLFTIATAIGATLTFLMIALHNGIIKIL
jgi:hypothetical protein